MLSAARALVVCLVCISALGEASFAETTFDPSDPISLPGSVSAPFDAVPVSVPGGSVSPIPPGSVSGAGSVSGSGSGFDLGQSNPNPPAGSSFGSGSSVPSGSSSLSGSLSSSPQLSDEAKQLLKELGELVAETEKISTSGLPGSGDCTTAEIQALLNKRKKQISDLLAEAYGVSSDVPQFNSSDTRLARMMRELKDLRQRVRWLATVIKDRSLDLPAIEKLIPKEQKIISWKKIVVPGMTRAVWVLGVFGDVAQTADDATKAYEYNQTRQCLVNPGVDAAIEAGILLEERLLNSASNPLGSFMPSGLGGAMTAVRRAGSLVPFDPNLNSLTPEASYVDPASGTVYNALNRPSCGNIKWYYIPESKFTCRINVFPFIDQKKVNEEGDLVNASDGTPFVPDLATGEEIERPVDLTGFLDRNPGESAPTEDDAIIFTLAP